MYKLGWYLPGNSCIHKIHPLAKIMAVIALSIIALRAGAAVLLATTSFLTASVLISRLEFKHLLQAIRPALPFFSLLFLLHLFFTNGKPIPSFPLGPVNITYEGLLQGGLLVWRFLLLVSSAAILTMTTSPSELVIGIEMLLRPLRVLGISSDDLAVMLSLAMRFIPILQEEIDRIREAQLVRGVDFRKGGALQKTKTVASMTIPLAINTIRRAEELATAMEARGYRRGHRTYLKNPSMKASDYLIAGAAVIAGIASLFFS